MKKIEKSEAEWQELLDDEQYRVLRKKGTERPFTGMYDAFYEEGAYHCAGCDAHLFNSSAKFNAGCGWPSFYAPATMEIIEEKFDDSHGMRRTEVLCSNCGGHLGHVFPDGPAPTGQRYCINSVSLKFKKNSK